MSLPQSRATPIASRETRGQPGTVVGALRLEFFSIHYFDRDGVGHETLVVRTEDDQIRFAPDANESEKWIRGLRTPTPQMEKAVRAALPRRAGAPTPLTTKPATPAAARAAAHAAPPAGEDTPIDVPPDTADV